MGMIVKPITPDGRAGYDDRGQLMVFSKPDEDGFQTGRFIRDPRAHTCYICGKGWGNTAEELLDQTILRNDPSLMAHQTCVFGHQKMIAHSEIQNALIEAGYLFKMEEVAPRYPHSTPWQRVTLNLNDRELTDSGHRLVIGRRKRVWEIRSSYVDKAMLEKFEDEDVTKGYGGSNEDSDFGLTGSHFYIHAWTQEKLIEYLTKIRESIPAELNRKEAK